MLNRRSLLQGLSALFALLIPRRNTPASTIPYENYKVVIEDAVRVTVTQNLSTYDILASEDLVVNDKIVVGDRGMAARQRKEPDGDVIGVVTRKANKGEYARVRLRYHQ